MIFDMTRRTGGGGGGLTPPTNAVAQFECGVTFSTQPATFTIDFTSVIAKLTSNKAYIYTLLLWRDDVVSATTYGGIVNQIFTWGRIATNAANGVNLDGYYTTSNSGNTNGNSVTMKSSFALSSGKGTYTLKNMTTADVTGKFKGIFTVMPPFTTSFTGEKLTTCPTGFLSYT